MVHLTEERRWRRILARHGLRLHKLRRKDYLGKTMYQIYEDGSQPEPGQSMTENQVASAIQKLVEREADYRA